MISLILRAQHVAPLAGALILLLLLDATSVRAAGPTGSSLEDGKGLWNPLPPS